LEAQSRKLKRTTNESLSRARLAGVEISGQGPPVIVTLDDEKEAQEGFPRLIIGTRYEDCKGREEMLRLTEPVRLRHPDTVIGGLVSEPGLKATVEVEGTSRLPKE
jgi:hypothetical protein